MTREIDLFEKKHMILFEKRCNCRYVHGKSNIRKNQTLLAFTSCQWEQICTIVKMAILLTVSENGGSVATKFQL